MCGPSDGPRESSITLALHSIESDALIIIRKATVPIPISVLQNVHEQEGKRSYENVRMPAEMQS